MKSLREAIRDGTPWLGDGAIGTWFLQAGVDPNTLPVLPLVDPDLVLRCHLEYLQAGARILETHTFSANRSKLADMGLTADVEELNRRAAQIARHARDTYGEPAYIVGSLGPLAGPVGTPAVPDWGEEAAVSVYREAVFGLLAGGVDGFVVETMSDLGTVRAAVRAIRGESDLPIFVLFSFSPLGTTLYGLTPEQAVEAVLTLPGGPPDVVGANCGSGPSPLLDAVIRMAPKARAAHIALAAYPNAGQPSWVDGVVRYPASWEYMAAIAPALKAAGCAVIGGCCGTTPEHIAAIRKSLDQPAQSALWHGHEPLVVAREEGGSGPNDLSKPERRRVTDVLADRFLISVELDPPRGPNVHRLLEAARQLKDAGVDAINVADSPMARVRLGAMATTRLVQEATGLPTILHFTTRDRNLMGLQSDLLGAYALGITNVLCLTGDPPGLGDYAHATAVYDLDSIGLTRVVAGFNQGHDAVEQPIGTPTRFAIGVGVNPNADDLEREVDRFRQKVAAGAQFVMSQPIYAPEQLYRFLDRVGGAMPIPLVLGLMPLVSYRQAVYLHNEVPGIIIPQPVLERMQHTQDGTQVGIALTMELVAALASVIRGVYLVPSFNRVELLQPLIPQIRQVMSNTPS